MALNKNHEFEELDGVKCGIVEKNISEERAAFLKDLLTYNGYTVKVVASPPAKAAAPASTDGEVENKVAAPSTFTLGVTDYTFNSTNAIFGRLLKTKSGDIVTLSFWKQDAAINNDEVPYFENEKTWK